MGELDDVTRTMNLEVSSLSASPPPFTCHAEAALLSGLEGPAAGTTVVVGRTPFVIGTSRRCDLTVSDATVSRKHVRAQWNGARLVLEDLGSKNGSYHGATRFETIELPLGAEFQIGESVFKILPAEQTVEPGEAPQPCFGALVGASTAMRRLFTLMAQVASTEVPILIEGETGVGKELVAEELHRRSCRRDQPFLIFDCGAVPSELIESALFGHLRGAFTGATQDRRGVFDAADGGTVFLDEVGELDLELQPALLRVLDRGMIRPVGATQFHTVDVRVIAATHRTLGAMIDEGSFREDLYYRLAVVRLAVPPLRDRPEDIEVLVEHFARRAGRGDLTLDREAIMQLRAHTWPGNVRELRNVIQRALALSSRDRLVIDGPLAPRDRAGHRDAPAAAPIDATMIGPDGSRIPFRDAKAATIEAFERRYLASLMSEHDSLTAAAAAASMDRKHLRKLLRRYGMIDGG